ncbi:hypothetical protein DVH24_009485 [Malus domestica]|uniref:Uncharacterized protein n=1 Tax=Malus domestica TaxID=3750 RepID=A0A498IU02_MALDO|nr:hypothetical protein DVH24_009485 [Malus domestica]
MPPMALSVGVDGHDLRVADMGDVLGEAFFVTDGFAFSFLGISYICSHMAFGAIFIAFKFQTLGVKFIN